jgi:hypothetical protein
MHRLMTLGAAACVVLMCGSAHGEDEEKPLVPELRDLQRRSGRSDSAESMRAFDNVIEQARTSTSYAVGANLKYNRQRKEKLQQELAARQRAMTRLDAIVGLQYDRIRDEFGGEIPPEYGSTVSHLQRQHEVMQTRLLKDIEGFTAELSMIDGRLARGAVEHEIAKVRETLLDPRESLDPADLGRAPEGDATHKDLAYLQRLSDKRVVGRVMRVAPLAPQPVSDLVIEHLMIEGW